MSNLSEQSDPTYLDDLNLLCENIIDKYPALDLKKKLFGTNIVALCEQLKPVMKIANNNLEAYRILQKVFVALHDAHSVILPNSNDSVGTSIELTEFEGKAIVTKNSGESTSIAIGDDVTALDDKTPTEYHVPRVVLNRPDYASITKISQGLIFFSPDTPEKKFVNVTFRKQSDEKEYSEILQFKKITAPTTAPTQLVVKDDRVVWKINTFSGGQATKNALLGDLKIINKSLPKLKHMIIDLRKNAGGSTNLGYPLLKLLLGKDLFDQMSINWQFRCNVSLKSVVNPNSNIDLYGRGCEVNDGSLSKLVELKLKDFGDDQDFDAFADQRLQTLDLKILIGPNSYSTTESFSRLSQLSHRATLVGRPTGGGGMAPKLNFTLPKSGLSVMLSVVDFLYEDGCAQYASLEGVGAIPDIECHPTLADVMGSTDSCLDKSISF